MPRLLSLLPALLLAGCPGDDGTAESGDTANDTGNVTGTTGEGTTEAPPQTTDGGETTTSDTTPGDSTTGGANDPMGACTAGCEHLVKCGVVDVPSCGIPCVGIGEEVAGCEAEYIAQQECVAALSCEQAQTWSDGMMLGGDYPCSSEDVAYQMCLAGETE